MGDVIQFRPTRQHPDVEDAGLLCAMTDAAGLTADPDCTICAGYGFVFTEPNANDQTVAISCDCTGETRCDT